jgi:hypothetical protein
MMVRFFSWLAVAFLLISPVQSLVAWTAGECRTSCDRYAEADHRVCSDLPANPSCAKAVEGNLQRCHESCGRTFPERSDPQLQEDEVRPEICDAESRSCR